MVAVFVSGLAGLLFLGTALVPPDGANFGQVRFENSCAPHVQESLQQAIVLLHSFEFGEATKTFRAVESDDPSCTIAAWGIALSNTEREGADRPARFLESGWKELQPWLSRSAKTEREHMFLDAVSKLYVGYEDTSADERWQRYITAMRHLRSRYPTDKEAAIFYALALTTTAGSGKTGIEQRREALDVLLPLFEENPKHPGAAHYILHAADTPEFAEIALPAARSYAAIAPASPHALHMPSHIFSRLGHWQEALDSNVASAQVAAAWVREGRDGLFDEQHALNHVEYAYLQLGQDHNAFEQIGIMQKLASTPGGDSWWPIDARIYYDLDTHNWADAIDIQPPAASSFAEDLDVLWIHTIAAARSNQAPQAEASLADFKKSSSEFEKQHGWGDLIHLEVLEAEAWTLFAQNDKVKAVETLQEAMSFEQAHPIYYPDVLPRPSPEMLGEMLLLLKSPDKALDAYKVALKIAPNRLNSLTGARDAAAASQQLELAAQYSSVIASICGNKADRALLSNH
jgi:tetratricopeptide (TPR) repeat protein